MAMLVSHTATTHQSIEQIWYSSLVEYRALTHETWVRIPVMTGSRCEYELLMTFMSHLPNIVSKINCNKFDLVKFSWIQSH